MLLPVSLFLRNREGFVNGLHGLCQLARSCLFHTAPFVHIRKANTELSMHFRQANTELSMHFRNANTDVFTHLRRDNTEFLFCKMLDKNYISPVSPLQTRSGKNFCPDAFN